MPGPRTTRASTSRCCGPRSRARARGVPRRDVRVLVDAHRARFNAGADHDRRARAEDARARGRAHRRHDHLLGQRARRRRPHRAGHHRRREAAGRPAPRVVVGLPVAVVDDADAGRARAEKLFASYLNIPTYQRILARGGDDTSPADVAIIGTEAEVTERLRSYAAAGATDLCATRSASTTIATHRSDAPSSCSCCSPPSSRSRSTHDQGSPARVRRADRDHHQRQRREAQRVRRRHGPAAVRRAGRAQGTARCARGHLAGRGQVVLVRS